MGHKRKSNCKAGRPAKRRNKEAGGILRMSRIETSPTATGRSVAGVIPHMPTGGILQMSRIETSPTATGRSVAGVIPQMPRIETCPMLTGSRVAQTILVCKNCNRRNHPEAAVIVFGRYDCKGLNSRRPFCNFVKRGLSSVTLCQICFDYLQNGLELAVGPNDWKYLWPGFIWRMLEDNLLSPSLDGLWSIVPRTWKGWWIDSLNVVVRHQRGLFYLTDSTTCVRDVTVERNTMLEADRTLEIRKLIRCWDDHMMPRVLCPWGCTEYYDLCGTIPFDVMVQRLVPTAIVKLSATSRSCQGKCVSCRHDLLSCGTKCHLDNPLWSIMPCVAVDEKKGLVWLTCAGCDGGRTKMVLHLPRLPQTLVPMYGNQLAPAVLQPRGVRVVRVGMCNITHQMVHQEASFGGVDTCFVSSHGRFDRYSYLGSIVEGLSLAGRQDIRDLLGRLALDGVVNEELVAAYLAHAQQLFGPAESFCTQEYGGTYIGYEDSIRLQKEIDEPVNIIVTSASTGQKQHFKPRFFKNIVFVHEHTRHGGWFSLIPRQLGDGIVRQQYTAEDGIIRNRVNCDMLIFICTMFAYVPSLWLMTFSAIDNTDDCAGYYLTFCAKHMFPGRCGRVSGTQSLEPFSTAARYSFKKCMLLFQELVGSDYGFIELEPFTIATLISLAYSVREVFASKEQGSTFVVYIENNPVLAIVDAEETKDTKFVCFVATDLGVSSRDYPVDELVREGRSYELRYVFIAGATVTESAVVYCRHGSQFQKYWKHVPGRSEPIDDVSSVFANWTCLLYVADAEPDYQKLRLDLLTSLGGQTKLCCREHGYPLIIQRGVRRRTGSVVDSSAASEQHSTEPIVTCSDHFDNGCMRVASLICPNARCRSAICAECCKSVGPTTGDCDRLFVNINNGVGNSNESDRNTNSNSEGNEDSDSEGNEDRSSSDSDDDYWEINSVADECLVGIPCGQSNPPSLREGLHDDLPNDSADDNFIPGTSLNTDESPYDYTLGPGMARVGLRSILNNCGSMLVRRSTEIRPSKVEQQFLQKIVVAFAGVSVPLIYVGAMLFPDVHPFDNQYDGSVIGCLPAPLLSTVAHCSRYNIESVEQHAAMRLRFPLSTSSTSCAYLCYMYDAVSNAKLQTTDTRLIKHRGIFATGTSGMMRADSQSNRMFKHTMDNHENVNLLCASQRYNGDNIFLTITPNQSMTPGLQPITDWLKCPDIVNAYQFYDPSAKNEILKAYIDASANLLCRNWARIRSQIARYIAYSSEKPLGTVKSFFFRDEYQGTEGNLCHIHALIETGHNLNDPASLREFRHLMRGTVVSLFDVDDVEHLSTLGVLKNDTDWIELQALASRVLTHRTVSARHKKRVGTKDTDLQSRLKDSEHWQQSPTEYIDVTVQPDHSGDVWRILLDLGFAVNKGDLSNPVYEITQPLLQSIRHYAPRSKAEQHFSPVNTHLFACLKSMQNIQHISGRSVAAYVCGYVASLDENLKVFLRAKAQQANQIIVSTEFLYNTKLQSSKHYNECRDSLNRKKSSGRGVVRHQAFSHLLSIPEVITNKNGIIIPTSFYELRSGIQQTEKVYSQSNQQMQSRERMEWYNGQADRDTIQFYIYADADRIDLELPHWRHFTMEQILTIQSNMLSKVSVDRVTIYSVRPPELHWVRSIGNYFRWFKIAERSLTPGQHRSSLNSTLFLSCFVDGFARQIKIRFNAIPEIKEYIENHEHIRHEIDDELMHVLEILDYIYIERQRELADFESFIQDTIHWDTDELLPSPIVTIPRSHDATQFLYHILLSMGEYITEKELLQHETLRDAFVAARLFNPIDATGSIQQLLSRYITEQLCYQPFGTQLMDEYIETAKTNFESVLVHDNIRCNTLPSCVQTQVHMDCSTQSRQYVDDIKKQVLAICLVKLDCMLRPLLCRRNIDSDTVTELTVKEEWFKQMLCEPMPKGATQSDDSYKEQEQLRALLRQIIDDYRNTSRTHQSTNLLIVGSPGTGKTFCELYAVLYAMAHDVFLLPTAFQAETAVAAGGLHDSKIFCLPVNHGANYKSSPYHDAELALLALAKNPDATQLLLEMDGEVKEEGAMICAEVWATEEIILRKLCNSDDYRADKLVISTMDHKQLKSIDGTCFLLSPAVLSNFKIFRLHHFVRSGLDPIFQRFIVLLRLSSRHLTNALLSEFRNLFMEYAIVVPDWNDPLITDFVIRMFPKHIARLRMEEIWVRAKCRSMYSTQYKLVASLDQMKKKKSKSVRWDKATQLVTGLCNTSFKEPQKLLLYYGGTYLLTFNKGKKFTQSRLAVLVDRPDHLHDYTKYSPIKMWIAPPSVRQVPAGCEVTLDKNILAQHGWVETKVGSAPLHSRSNDKLGIMYQRKQYGLRHNIAATIHSTIGATLPVVAIQISHSDSDYSVWEKGMIQVAATRTTEFKNTIWVGEREDILAMLLEIMLKDEPMLDYVDQLIDKLSMNQIDVVQRLSIPEIDRSLYRRYSGTYSLNKDILPGDNSGYVYLLLSLKTKSVVYIGQTINLPRRILQHNQGCGAQQTKSLRLRPWAVLAYIGGFNGQRELLHLCEQRWNYWAKNRRPGERSLTWTYQAAMHTIRELGDADLRLVRYATLELPSDDHLVL